MKEILRKEYKEKRNLLSKEEVKEKSKNAARLFLESEIYKTASHIMLYMSLGSETETNDIINKALSDGKTVSVPVTEKKTGKITSVIIDKDTDFLDGTFGIKEPQNTIEEKAENIDTVLVPGIAFDKRGNRIGFGKGCYDMFLKNLNVTKIGYCYHFQIAQNLPSSEFDIPMDFVVTDKEVIRCK